MSDKVATFNWADATWPDFSSDPADEIIAAGFDPATVRRVLRMVRLAEFKRKQAAPGLKVTDRAFGTGWRMPIAAQPDIESKNVRI